MNTLTDAFADVPLRPGDVVGALLSRMLSWMRKDTRLFVGILPLATFMTLLVYSFGVTNQGELAFVVTVALVTLYLSVRLLDALIPEPTPEDAAEMRAFISSPLVKAFAIPMALAMTIAPPALASSAFYYWLDSSYAAKWAVWVFLFACITFAVSSILLIVCLIFRNGIHRIQAGMAVVERHVFRAIAKETEWLRRRLSGPRIHSGRIWLVARK